MLRPFVYRKYLDYTAFAGLRDMKALIDAEVARKDLANNLKLGPGGIREIEFIVQLAQMIRGGREPSMRVRGLLPALSACQERGHIDAKRAGMLREAYVLLRRVENHVQMLRDAQTHDIPETELGRERLALSLDYPDWEALEAALARQRAIVSEEFAAVLMPQGGRTASAPAADKELWRLACDESLDAGVLEASGFEPGAELADVLLKLPQASQVRAMSTAFARTARSTDAAAFQRGPRYRCAGIESAAAQSPDAGGGTAFVVSRLARGAAGCTPPPGPPVR